MSHPSESNYKITLNSGRIIALEEIHQHLTYLGLLEGLPNSRMNNEILKELPKIANKKIWGNTSPYIIKPKGDNIKLKKERIEYYKSKGSDFVPMSFPKICCLGHFSSNSITDDYMFSNLTIAWFQDDWIMPIDELILNQIKQLNWDNLAIEGDY